MPALDNPKYEAFAQNLAKGMTQIAAYRKAGYNGNASNASNLARDATVKARVNEIRIESAGRLAGIEAVRHAALLDEREKKPGIDLDWLKHELMETIRITRDAGEHDTTLKAIELGARLIGVPLKDKDMGSRGPTPPNGSSSNSGNSGALAALNRFSERLDRDGGDNAPAADRDAAQAQPVPGGADRANGTAKPDGSAHLPPRRSGGGIPGPAEIGSVE